MSNPTEGKVPVFESVGAAFTYFKENWQAWVPAAAVVGLIYGVAMYVWPDLYASQSGAMTESGGVGAGLYLGLGIISLATLMFNTGVLRQYLRGEFTQPIGITLGLDEFRVLGISLGMMFIFGIVTFFAMFIMMIVIVGGSGIDPAVLESQDPEAVAEALFAGGGGLIALVALLAFLAAMVWVLVRLTFYQAATVAEQRMMGFSTWKLSKGNFWRILGALCLVMVPVVIATGVLSELTLTLFGAVGGIGPFLYGFVYAALSTVISIVPTAPDCLSL